MTKTLADINTVLFRLEPAESARRSGRIHLRAASAARVVRALVDALPEPSRSQRELAFRAYGLLPDPSAAGDDWLLSLARACGGRPGSDPGWARIPVATWLEALRLDNGDVADPVAALSCATAPSEDDGPDTSAAVETEATPWDPLSLTMALQPERFTDADLVGHVIGDATEPRPGFRAWPLHAVSVERVAALDFASRPRPSVAALARFAEIASCLDPDRRAALLGAARSWAVLTPRRIWPHVLRGLFATADAGPRAGDVDIDHAESLAAELGMEPTAEEQTSVDAVLGDNQESRRAKDEDADPPCLFASSPFERRTRLAKPGYPDAIVDLVAVSERTGLPTLLVRNVLARQHTRATFDVPLELLDHAAELEGDMLVAAIEGTHDGAIRDRLAQLLVQRDGLDLDRVDSMIIEAGTVEAIGRATIGENLERGLASVVSLIRATEAMRCWCVAATPWAARGDVPLETWASALHALEDLDRQPLACAVGEPPARDFLLVLGRRAVAEPGDNSAWVTIARVLSLLVGSSRRLGDADLRLAEAAAAAVLRYPEAAGRTLDLREGLLEALVYGADVRVALAVLPRGQRA